MLLGVDVGGTFTDAVLLGEDGLIHCAKVASTPQREQLGVLQAVAAVLAKAGAQSREVRRFAHGMTVATNALLEGRVARTALVATEGFTDVIELARQNRVHLYRLCERGPEPLVAAQLRFAAPERMGPEGPIRALGEQAAERLAEEVLASEPQAVAVALLHSYADPAHEQLIAAALAAGRPQLVISLSSELVGTFREYERTATTALDAALSPTLATYLSALSEQTRQEGLPEPRIMQSSGGLTDPTRAARHAALTVLSGPAGGVSGASLLAAQAGESDVACFDMGGTSCDVCLIEAGTVAETSERVIAGRPVALPALDIHTVGAGGGSIAWRDEGGALRVGPASAGARPGPACYGRGGELPTVTDANLLLGRLRADVPLAGVRLDLDAAERAVARLAAELRLSPLACAEGIVRVAEEEMLGALRLVTMERGVDPRAFALLAFGGAGGLHAAAMAERLGISRVLSPIAGGVLSALGLAAAAPRRDAARTVMLELSALDRRDLDAAREPLLQTAAQALGEEPLRLRVRYELRYRGQSFELAVDERLDAGAGCRLDAAALGEAFAREHEARYGYRDDELAVELVNLRASAWGEAPSLPRAGSRALAPAESRGEIRFGGETLAARVLCGAPEHGGVLEGPALCAMEESTLLVPPGWRAWTDEQASTIRMSANGSGDARRD